MSQSPQGSQPDRAAWRRTAAAVSCLIWGFVNYQGYHALAGFNLLRFDYLWVRMVCLPATMVLVSLALLLLAARMPRRLFTAVLVMQLAVMLPAFLYWPITSHAALMNMPQ